MNNISKLEVYFVQRSHIKEVKRKYSSPNVDFFLQRLASERIAKDGQLSYVKLELSPNDTIIDVLKELGQEPFSEVIGLEWVIEYGYVFARPTFKFDSAWNRKDTDESVGDKVKSFHAQTISQLNIQNHEVLHIVPIEVARKHTGVVILRCMGFPRTVVDFVDMVNADISDSKLGIHLALLYTDTDLELCQFIRRAYSDLHILSGSTLNVYAVEKLCHHESISESVSFWHSLLSERLYTLWSSFGWLNRKPYDKAQCYEIGKKLGVRADQFPCAVIFNDITPESAFIFPIVKPYDRFFRTLLSELNNLLKEIQDKYDSGDSSIPRRLLISKFGLARMSDEEYMNLGLQYERLREKLMSLSTSDAQGASSKYMLNELPFFISSPHRSVSNSQNFMTQRYAFWGQPKFDDRSNNTAISDLENTDRKIKILFLAANPSNSTRLRIDAESRSIDRALQQSKYRDAFDIKQHWAVRISDLSSLLLRHQPDIVHFSGHGSSSNEIVLENESGDSCLVSKHALTQLFNILTDNVKCVVLNACFSRPQAEAIAEHIDCVIGMSDTIEDIVAIRFSSKFYEALGFGRDIKTAFELGRLQIDLENLNEQDVPQLVATKRDPKKLFLAGEQRT